MESHKEQSGNQIATKSIHMKISQLCAVYSSYSCKFCSVTLPRGQAEQKAANKHKAEYFGPIPLSSLAKAENG